MSQAADQSGARLGVPVNPAPAVEPEPVKPTEVSDSTTDVAEEQDPPPPEAGDTTTAAPGQRGRTTFDPPNAPDSPQSRAQNSITGRISYRRKERSIKEHIRECGKKGLGDEGLLLRITIDGRHGRAEVEVRGPALARGEPPATCAIRAIQSLEFDKFEGKPFLIEKWFDFSG